MKNRIIYLAGGNSSRFHANKLLYEVKGRPLFRHTLDVLYEIVKNKEEYSLLVISQYKELLDSICEDVQKVHCLDCQKGISYSIQHAIEALPKEEGYDTFVVADQPYLTFETLSSFMETSIQNRVRISCVSYKEELYNPVMFHTDYEQELCLLKNDQGGKKIVREHIEDVYRFEIKNNLELKDIDTIEDIV